MGIKITENGVVRYENGPNVDRLLFPNVPGGYASPEQITQAVDAWLEDHPEATTTVTDGSISRVKLDSELNSYIEDLKPALIPFTNNIYDFGFAVPISRADGEPQTKWFGFAPSKGMTLTFENNSDVNISIVAKKGSQTSKIIDTIYAGAIREVTINDDYSSIGVYFYSYGSGKLIIYGADYIIDTIEKKIKSIFTPISIPWVSGYYVRYSDGVFMSNGSSQYSGYVECANIGLLKLTSYISTAGATLAFYDDKKVYMKSVSVQGTNAIQNLAITMPANAKYFVCSHYGTGDKDIIAYSTLQKATNDLCGLKVMFFGDSITANDSGYRKYLVEKTGMIDIGSFAISGATLTNNDDTVMDGNPTTESNNTVPNQVKKMISGEYDTPDIVIVSACTNDSESHFVFKESEYQLNGSYIDVDTCDLTNASGAMRWIYEKIMSVYPDTKVFFATPIQSATPTRTFASLKTKRDVIAENTERMSIGLIDAYYQSGIYSRYETNEANGKYLADGLHPNTFGAIVLADCYAISIKNQKD